MMPRRADGRQRQASGEALRAAAAQAGIESHPGKGALRGHSAAVDCEATWDWSEAIDLDHAFAQAEPNAARWDFGVGLCRRGGNAEEIIVWVEAHPASSTGAVAEMLAKAEWLKAKLRERSFSGFQALSKAAQQHGLVYRWLARTGAIHIRPGTREHRRLIKAGLAMPARHLTLP